MFRVCPYVRISKANLPVIKLQANKNSLYPYFTQTNSAHAQITDVTQNA